MNHSHWRIQEFSLRGEAIVANAVAHEGPLFHQVESMGTGPAWLGCLPEADSILAFFDYIRELIVTL